MVEDTTLVIEVVEERETKGGGTLLTRREKVVEFGGSQELAR